MHDFVNNLCQSLPNLTHNHGLYLGVAPPGLTYLTYRWRVKQGEEENKGQAKNVAMHLRVCLNTLILPLIICNLSNLALYRLLALLQDSFTEKRDEQCACCIRDEHTCGLYLIHRSLFVYFRILGFLTLLSMWAESVCLFINVCLVIFQST